MVKLTTLIILSSVQTTEDISIGATLEKKKKKKKQYFRRFLAYFLTSRLFFFFFAVYKKILNAGMNITVNTLAESPIQFGQ